MTVAGAFARLSGMVRQHANSTIGAMSRAMAASGGGQFTVASAAVAGSRTVASSALTRGAAQISALSQVRAAFPLQGAAVLGHRMASQAAASQAPHVALSPPKPVGSDAAAVAASTSEAGLLVGGDSDDEGVLCNPKKKRKFRYELTSSFSPHERGVNGLLSTQGRSLSMPELQHIGGSAVTGQLLRSFSASALASAVAASARDSGGSAASEAEASLSTAAADFLAKHDIHVVSKTGAAPPPILSFADTGFPRAMLHLIKHKGFTEPTPIQAAAWPVALSKQSVIAIASTGSGKTAGFLLPALTRIAKGDLAPNLKASLGRKLSAYASPEERREHQRAMQRAGYAGATVLVIAPTRELACQIHDEASAFGKPLGISSVVLYGGTSRYRQIEDIQRIKPQIIIATPGRLLDLCQDHIVDLANVQYLVLDEADRMLDMGFEPQINDICDQLPEPPIRQTVFFSATWPREVRSLASRVAGADPVQVFVGDVGEQPVAARTISQEVQLVTYPEQKLLALKRYLLALVDEQTGGSTSSTSEGGGETGSTGGDGDSESEEARRESRMRARREKAALQRGRTVDPLPDFRVIVFTATKMAADRLTYWLNDIPEMPRAEAVHGDKSQSHRDATLRAFRSGRVKLLVATDVAARGLDVPNVTAVVNYDVPESSRVEDYVHRIGRTGRAGAKGRSLVLLNQNSTREKSFVQPLIKILKEAGQPVPEELQQLSGVHGRYGRGGGDGYRGSSQGRSAYGASRGGRGGWGGGQRSSSWGDRGRSRDREEGGGRSSSWGGRRSYEVEDRFDDHHYHPHSDSWKRPAHRARG